MERNLFQVVTRVWLSPFHTVKFYGGARAAPRPLPGKTEIRFPWKAAAVAAQRLCTPTPEAGTPPGSAARAHGEGQPRKAEAAIKLTQT